MKGQTFVLTISLIILYKMKKFGLVSSRLVERNEWSRFIMKVLIHTFILKNLALDSVHFFTKTAKQIIIKCLLHKTIVLTKLCVKMNLFLLPILNFFFAASLGYYSSGWAEFTNFLWYCLLVAIWTFSHISFSWSCTNPDAFFWVWNHHSQILMNIFCQQ